MEISQKTNERIAFMARRLHAMNPQIDVDDSIQKMRLRIFRKMDQYDRNRASLETFQAMIIGDFYRYMRHQTRSPQQEFEQSIRSLPDGYDISDENSYRFF